tara:strand:- start:9 stop:875 length:867 start_codon:yes stop_codon:yes gene_type:complete
MSKPYLNDGQLSGKRYSRLFVSPVVGLVLGLVGVMSNNAVARGVAEPITPASRMPHDSKAFTQGFIIDDDGHWYESTGLYGHSQLRRVAPASGHALQRRALARRYFGEGLARFDDRLYQLTWKAGQVFVYDRATFARLDSHEYTGQGWGLARCGHQLVMSDGSDTLVFRRPDDFSATQRLPVRWNGQPVSQLNELETINGMIWANQWHTNRLLIIDPGTGRVVAVRSADALAAEQPDTADVFNGIAYDANADRVYVTGKQWAWVYTLGPDASQLGVDQRTSERCIAGR